MDVAVVALIVTAIALAVGLLIWRLTRRRTCPQCGRPVPSGEEKCSFCHASLSSGWTAFQHFPTGRLAFIDGPHVGQELELIGKQVRIGRAPDSDVRLDDDLVSWEHAILSFSDGQHILFDRDSTNGTWVNGERIAQCVIQPGVDQIRIGPSVFILRVAGQRAATPSPLPMTTPPKEPVRRVYDFGDYERIATLGGGGASVVYKAVSRRDGQIVAIKVLQRSDPYLRDKFQKEGKELARLLRHPHIVRVYGGGESRGMHYLVMEFMDGGTLRERLAPGRSLPPDQVITIAGQMCDALQYAHRTGIYHRDIKPENVFFSSDGKGKLGDFGIARIARSVTRTASGWLLGTPHYMSFEQAKGHPIDGRSDLYSLGVVLYEMVTGRCPFVAESPLALVDKHIKEYPAPPSRFNPSIPTHVENVIMRALEKDRDRRFATAEEMARALGYTAPMHDGEIARVPSVAIAPTAAPQRWKPRPVAASGGLHLVRAGGTAIALRGKTTTLSRRNVNPGDLEISRAHARVVERGGHYWIEELGSSNGTFVNGLRIFGPQLLREGDEIQLGRTVLRVKAW